MDPPQTFFDEKNLKIVHKQFLMAQKKRLDAQNASQKTSAPHKVWFLKKIMKNLQKITIFGCFSDFSSSRVLGGPKVTRRGKKD